MYSTDKNAPPKANAGGDQVVVAPISALIINGSQSTDDLRINEWIWSRDPSSLAIGTIVQNTDKSSVLMVIILLINITDWKFIVYKKYFVISFLVDRYCARQICF